MMKMGTTLPTHVPPHRHRPAAAGTDITLVGGRRGEFTRSKIAVNDLVVGVACDATADCSLRADDLLAFACDQHVTGSLLHAFSAHCIAVSIDRKSTRKSGSQ